jgi:hypothetical protein
MEKAPNMHRSQIGCSVFGVAGGDAAPLFQPKKDVFNQMAHFIEMLIVWTLVLSIFPGRDNRHYVSSR